MSTVVEQKRAVTPPPPNDPWYYGWRDVFQIMPDGTKKHVQIPLTLEDALHPQEGDHIMESNLHDLLTTYLAGVFRYRVADDPQALVLSNTGVYWDHPDLDHHAPDVCLIFGVKQRKPNWLSFHVRSEGVSAHSIIEVVSPNTRSNDVATKMVEYHMAHVPFYFIFDKEREADPWTLRGYRWTPTGFSPLAADLDGRIWFDALGIWLAAEGHNIVCYDGKTNERIGDYVENSRQLESEKQRAEAEKQRAETEKQRAETEKQRAETEKQRAEAAEAKVKEMEAEINRLRGQ